MKKTVIILGVLVLFLGGCKTKTTSTSFPQTDTLYTAQQAEPTQKTDEEKELRYQKERQKYIDEFNTHLLVSAEEVAMIAPIIKQWIDFCNIDFAQARLIEVVDSAYSTCLDCPDDTMCQYYKEYLPEYNSSNIISV